MNKYPHLFEPIRIGTQTVRNRVFMPPISTNLANKGYVTDELVQHYGARAKGGVGLIVSEKYKSPVRCVFGSQVLQLRKEFSMTVILVTHDREEALSMSDRIALLFDGQLSQIGTPRQVYERPQTKQVADYFGNCVYIPGQVSGGIFTADGISCPVTAPDGSYHIMLRPDCLEPNCAGDYSVRVEEIAFRGTDSLIFLRSPDGTLWKKSCVGPVALEIGQTVHAQLTVTNPVLFP